MLFVFDISWNDYYSKVRDFSICVQRITKLIICRKELDIRQILSPPCGKNSWFSNASFPAIKDSEAVHKIYLSILSPTNYNLCISVGNQARIAFRLVENFRKQKMTKPYYSIFSHFWLIQEFLSRFHFFVFSIVT